MTGPRYATSELLARLVSFDTTSQLSNLPLVDFVREYLAAHGVRATSVPDDTGTKAALFATIGAHVRGGVVLSGHTDVVPVTGQPWTSDPFTLTRRDGRLYARGATDMKGFVAAVLAIVPDLVAARLARPVHIALSYDEEVGCLGVRPLVTRMAEAIATPAAVIVGEPTGLKPVDAHKSAHLFETVVTGREAHSSMPGLGASAIVAGARLVAELERLSERLARTGDPSGRFDPPSATLNVGLIEGGTAHNIVPRRCRLVWGLRGLPDTDIEAVLRELDAFAQGTLVAQMRRTAPEAAITTTEKTSILPLAAQPGSTAEALIAKLTGVARMSAVSYGTDAGFFQRIGWPSVVCGPGDIARAHKPDEYIEEREIADCDALLHRLRDELVA